jgi:hypothetical protein
VYLCYLSAWYACLYLCRSILLAHGIQLCQQAFTSTHMHACMYHSEFVLVLQVAAVLSGQIFLMKYHDGCMHVRDCPGTLVHSRLVFSISTRSIPKHVSTNSAKTHVTQAYAQSQGITCSHAMLPCHEYPCALAEILAVHATGHAAGMVCLRCNALQLLILTMAAYPVVASDFKVPQGMARNCWCALMHVLPDWSARLLMTHDMVPLRWHMYGPFAPCELL